MTRLALAILFALPALARAGDPAAALASTIDRHVAAKLAEGQVPTAPRADDATYFRRIHLALGGRIPTASEVRQFLESADPDKRAKALDRLLASAAYANHLTTVIRGWLLPEAIANPEVAGAVPGFEAWLRHRVQTNQPYDKFVQELITFPLDARQANPRAMADDGPTGTPVAFYNAKEGKPENLAAATSRLFLGVQLECAQCHNHPFAKWNREQFWGLAAFFGGVTRQDGGLRELPNRREMGIPNTDRTVPATFLDDKEPSWQFRKSPRVTLANWIVEKDNPFFAKATVNRLWGHLFGAGIVDPVDDFHEQNPPSHPELLAALAAAFADSGYDVKFLLRAICLSETFSRSSATSHAGQRNVRLFAAFPVQGLTPEQLFDSLSVVAGTPLEGPGGNYLANGSPKRQFVETFNRMGKPTETQTTIIQALSLMNGSLVGQASDAKAGRTLAAILELPGLTPTERIESIYLTILGRKPKSIELDRTLKHAADGKSERYSDVFWALLNGVEFRTNH
ncbi:MAG: DUF1553 domain-containing protein [Gemmataceae bacterium]|nr:DUF1553 domain-containing protein [Gemmataceae bacterium]